MFISIKEPGPIPVDQLILALGFLFMLAFVPIFALLFLIFRKRWKVKRIIWRAVIIAVILELIFVGYQMYSFTKVIY